MLQPSSIAWRERARLAQELLCGCGPFDMHDELYKIRERAFEATTKLLHALDEVVSAEQAKDERAA